MAEEEGGHRRAYGGAVLTENPYQVDQRDRILRQVVLHLCNIIFELMIIIIGKCLDI